MSRFHTDVIVFIGSNHNVFDVTQIIFSIMVSPLILEISLFEIKAKMYKLPIINNKNLRNTHTLFDVASDS